MDKSEVIEIYSAANAIEAYAVANALEAEGIRARVIGELSGGLPNLFPSRCPSVCIYKEDEQRAREIIVQWQKEAKTPPESIKPGE